ncbi:hypothetical protein IPL85_05015 [Candidatus Saccharibacteria bacterium]|nr:MAG: hypothetical protein IPL85_05015 [Candidatus Saccharibacteria bacterium]
MDPDLLVHPETVAALARYISNPTHAVLLTGTVGVGKTHLAIELVGKLLGVPSNKVTGQAFVRLITPEKGVIAIKPIRDLVSFVSLVVPGEKSVSRAIVIVDAETMSRQAQNALLKLLEEPPERTVLILTSSAPGKLLATIRSRVQILRVRLPEPEDTKKYFLTKGFDTAHVEQAILLGGGSPSVVNQLLEESASEGFAVYGLVKRALTGDKFSRLTIIDSDLKDKEQAAQFVDTLVLVASMSLRQSENTVQWQRILTSGIIAQKALAQRGHTKLVLTELMLEL